VIQQSDIDQFEGCFKALGDALIGLTGFCHTRWMIVSEDYRRSIHA
jgi:hypothetical protein